MEGIYWSLTFASVIGSFLNNYQRKECFYIWIAANCLWTIVYFHTGLYAQAFQFAFFTLFSVQGLVKWVQIENKYSKRRRNGTFEIQCKDELFPDSTHNSSATS